MNTLLISKLTLLDLIYKMSTFAVEYDFDGSSIIRYGPTGYAEWMMDINGITDIINCEFEWLRDSEDPLGDAERFGDVIMAVSLY